MRPFLITLVLASTTSCASSGSSPGSEMPTPSDRVVATDNHTTYRTTVAPNAKASLPVAQSRAFEALRGVYAELGVPPSMDDAANGRVGNTNFFKSRKFGNEAMSSYLNCGNSITGSAADNYRINMEGTAGDRIACGTTGRLEERIRQSVLRKVGGVGG
jgi:hypothetical protein